MKKTALAVLLALSIFIAGCSKTAQPIATQPTATLKMAPTGTDEEIINKYLQDSKEWLSDAEEEIALKEGYRLGGQGIMAIDVGNYWSDGSGDEVAYYLPVMYQVEGRPEIVGITKRGELKINDKTLDIHGNCGGEQIMRGYEGNLYYESGIISHWAYGTQTNYNGLPEDSVYCGVSAWAGHIFRSGSDVYTFNFEPLVPNRQAEKTVQKIATGVKSIIVADYAWNSDRWSQPLFLMVDGSIKVYDDNDGQLYDIHQEGGYRK